MSEILSSPLFGITLCIFTFEIGCYLSKKTRLPLFNPLFVSILLVIAILQFFHIPLEDFQRGGDVISLFLAPATASIALSMYRQIETLKKNLIPILAGCIAGALTSLISVSLLCQAFGLDGTMTASLLPKSVTTPIAMEISKQLGGIPSISVAIVIFTGILGAMFSPLLIKLFRIKNPVAAGVGIGASSHSVGTSKAIELGETEGAMSGIAMGLSGLITVILALFL